MTEPISAECLLSDKKIVKENDRAESSGPTWTAGSADTQAMKF